MSMSMSMSMNYDSRFTIHDSHITSHVSPLTVIPRLTLDLSVEGLQLTFSARVNRPGS